MRILSLLLLIGCATFNPYAYRGPSRPECKAECASRGYAPYGDGMTPDGQGCVCDPRSCTRPKHRGGCEVLPTAPNAVAPNTQM